MSVRDASSGLSSEGSDEFLQPKKTISWNTLVRVTAWVLRCFANCREKETYLKLASKPLSVEERIRAEVFWIKKAQAYAYSDDVKKLMAG